MMLARENNFENFTEQKTRTSKCTQHLKTFANLITIIIGILKRKIVNGM